MVLTKVYLYLITRDNLEEHAWRNISINPIYSHLIMVEE